MGASYKEKWERWLLWGNHELPTSTSVFPRNLFNYDWGKCIRMGASYKEKFNGERWWLLRNPIIFIKPAMVISGYHLYKILVVCPLRKVGGSDLTPLHKRLYLWPSSITGYNEAISVSASLGTIATGMNTSFLDGLYKTKQQNYGDLHSVACSLIGKQLNSWEDIVRVVITEVVDSDFDSRVLKSCEGSYEQANGQLIDSAMCSNRMPWMRMLNRMFQNVALANQQLQLTLACGRAS